MSLATRAASKRSAAKAEEEPSPVDPITTTAEARKTSKRAKKTPVSASDQDPELIDQVVAILQEFFRASLDFSTGSGHLSFESSDAPLVEGKSFGDPDGEEEELLVITRKDEQPFTRDFLIALRPKLVTVVNDIVQATNDWLEATKYHDARLNQAQIDEFLNIFLDPVVSTEDDEEEVRTGAIGFRRASGNLSTGCWDYTEAFENAADYKHLPKGDEKKVNPVK